MTKGSTKQQYLGSENQQNVYSGEITAIEMAVNIAQTCQNNYKQCVIYTDSQAAIKATVKPGKQSGQSILCSLPSSIDNLISSRGMDLHIEWIPSHRDIEELLPILTTECEEEHNSTQHQHQPFRQPACAGNASLGIPAYS